MRQPLRKGLPRPALVSDRWHLGKNLSAYVSTLLANALTELRLATQTKTTPQRSQGDRRQPETAAVQQAQHIRQAERTEAV